MKRWIVMASLLLTGPLQLFAQTIPPHAEGLQETLVEVHMDEGTQRAVLSQRMGQPPGTQLIVLLPGYPSVVRPEVNQGVLMASPLMGNFLIRARRHLVTDQVMTLLVDCHTSVGDVCKPEYQASEKRYRHVKAVIDATKSQWPSIRRVYLLSTSAGSISSAFMAKYGQTEFAGVIHTASIDPTAARSYTQLTNFDYGSITIPQAFIHHVDDPCSITSYHYIRSVADKYQLPLISVTGGSDFRGQPCMAFTQHGFRNKEVAVMRHILTMLDASTWQADQL